MRNSDKMKLDAIKLFIQYLKKVRRLGCLKNGNNTPFICYSDALAAI